MASLGEFGEARKAANPDVERDTLSLCGVEFKVADAIDPLAILDYGEAAAAGIDGDTPEGMAAMKALIRAAVDEAEWPRFRATVRRHRPNVEVLMQVAWAVIQRETGRPTQAPSDSSDGSPATGTSSREPSSSVVSSTRDPWADTPQGRRELAVHPEVYADVLPIDKAATMVGKLAG